jgi:type I restriction enzyme S subunit
MAGVEKLITEHIDVWTSAIKKRNSQGRGSNKKIELTGIKKLRELILELAVRGKLVPQDPSDEPASVLLAKIAEEKAQLLKDKLIKKPKKLPEIDEEDKTISLPEGWEFVRLNELGEWGAGATPRRGNSELYGGDIPWFKSGELNADYIDKSEETVTELALKQASLRYNKIGDVLLAMYGATIGKTAILKVRATTNQAVCACTPFTGFSNIFLLTLLKAYKPKFIGMGAGGAQPNISREKIIATVIALPPLAEQQRIVAKVDELMALCDQLEQQTEKSLIAHQTLVEVLLASLTSDTLTDGDSKEDFQTSWQRIAEHFDVLFTTEASIDALKRTVTELAATKGFSNIACSRNDSSTHSFESITKRANKEQEISITQKEGKKEKIIPLVIESPFQNIPTNWIKCNLGEITISLDHKRVPIKKSERSEGDVPYYGANGPVGFIGESVFDEKLVLVVEDETFIGRIKPFSYIIEGASWVNNHVHVLKCTSVILPEFLNIALSYYPFIPLTSGTTGRKKLTKNTLLQVPIIFPPLSEQHRIVAKIDELMALCEQLKARLSDAQTTQLHLADAVVESALT